jgi:hypothetical protein
MPRTYKGYPVIVSAEAGANAIILDANAIMLADDGLQIDASDQAALQMSDAPDTPPTAYVSMWQTDCAAIRVERFIGWRPIVAGAVQYAGVAP